MNIKSRTTLKYSNARGNKTIIEWDIDDDNKHLNLKIKGRVNVRVVMKTILYYTEKFHKYKYKRVSPYKIYTKYNEKIKRQEFKIEFLDLSYDKHEKIVLDADDTMCMTDGEYKIMIVDLLEFAYKYGYVNKSYTEYSYIKEKCEKIAKRCSEIHKLINRDTLIADGWSVPPGYEKAFKKAMKSHSIKY